MSEEGELLKEGAKALTEVAKTTGKAIDATRSAGGWLDRIFGTGIEHAVAPRWSKSSVPPREQQTPEALGAFQERFCVLDDGPWWREAAGSHSPWPTAAADCRMISGSTLARPSSRSLVPVSAQYHSPTQRIL
jgi:hypothetical protein